MASSKALFIDPNEVEIANLRSGSINPSGSVGGSYCLLSDKRVYYRGAAVAYNGSQILSTESVIDLKSITGTAFSVRRLPGFLIMGVIFLLTAIAGLLLEPIFNVDVLSVNGLEYLPYVVGGVALLFLVLYIFIRKKIFSIMYVCGELSFPASISTVKTIRAFCARIHAAASFEREKEAALQRSQPASEPRPRAQRQVHVPIQPQQPIQSQVVQQPVQPQTSVRHNEQTVNTPEAAEETVDTKDVKADAGEKEELSDTVKANENNTEKPTEDQ